MRTWLLFQMQGNCAQIVSGAQRLIYIGDVTQFFGDDDGMHPLSVLILWIISSVVLTLPWVWLLLTTRIKGEWALPIGLCLTGVLPTGVINPLTVAGVRFPGLGWVGLLATIILFGTLSKYRVSSLLSAGMLAAICYVSHSGTPTIPPAWQGVDTELGGDELSKQTPMALYKAVVYVQETALDSNAQIQVFPEGLVNHWDTRRRGVLAIDLLRTRTEPPVEA